MHNYTKQNNDKNVKNAQKTLAIFRESVYNKIGPNLELVSVTPAEFLVNDKELVKDPKGMEAYKLSVSSILGTVPKKNVYTLINILEALGIRVVDLAFGGTSILIVVGVALETVQQLESQLVMRHYKGFLE